MRCLFLIDYAILANGVKNKEFFLLLCYCIYITGWPQLISQQTVRMFLCQQRIMFFVVQPSK